MRRTLGGLPAFDVVLAVALLAAKVATLASGVQGGPALSYVLAPLWTLPLAWRRRNPPAVALVIGTSAVLEVALVGYHDSVVDLAVWVMLPYSIGAHSQTKRRMLAGVALSGAAGMWSAAHQSGAFASDVLGSAAVFLVAFLAGLALRQQRLRAQALEQLALQLEREREERARSAVAEERARIARELHDEVAHAMSVIAVQADAAEGALAHDPALVTSPLVAIRETARTALADMRRMLGALHTAEPVDLAPEPGLSRLDGLLEQARAAGIDVRFSVQGEPIALSPALDLAAYRVMQEGLTNVRKHAAARRVDVVLRYGDDKVVVEVTDDGEGARPRPGTGRGGRGLAGARERVALLGGEFTAGPHPDGGFALSATLPTDVIRVLLADDQELVRSGFRLMLEVAEGIDVVGEAADGLEAVRLAKELQPHVVLMDVRMPEVDGIEATRRLRQAGVETSVLVLTTFDLDEYVYAAVRAGASGFLLKDAPREQLITAVRTIARGEALLAPAITRRLIERFMTEPAPDEAAPGLAELSARELEVLRLLARGLSNAEIASELIVGEATVKTHVARVLRKLDLRDRIQAVVFAYETGLVRPGSAGCASS